MGREPLRESIAYAIVNRSLPGRFVIVPAQPEPRIMMRSRSPLLASRAFKLTVALVRGDCGKKRVHTRGLYEILLIKSVGSHRAWRRDAITVGDKPEQRTFTMCVANWLQAIA